MIVSLSQFSGLPPQIEHSRKSFKPPHVPFSGLLSNITPIDKPMNEIMRIIIERINSI